MRNSDFMRHKFLPLWHVLTNSPPGYAFTDNGSMFEAILQLFCAGYRPRSCPTGPKILKCGHRQLDMTFGSIGRGPRGGSSGLLLVPPGEGFNNHVSWCPEEGHKGVTFDARHECNKTEFDRSIRKTWGWHFDDVVNNVNNVNNSMFAMHHKDARLIDKLVLLRTLAPSDVAC